MNIFAIYSVLFWLGEGRGGGGGYIQVNFFVVTSLNRNCTGDTGMWRNSSVICSQRWYRDYTPSKFLNGTETWYWFYINYVL